MRSVVLAIVLVCSVVSGEDLGFVVTNDAAVVAQEAPSLHAMVFTAAWCPGCPKIKEEMRSHMQGRGWKLSASGHFEFVDVESDLGRKYWDAKDGGVPQVAILLKGRVVARFYGVTTGEDLDRKFRAVWR